MKIHELYSDSEGESHWRETPVTVEERAFAPPAKAIEVSAPHPARRTMFLRLRCGWDEPVHPTPVPQRLVCLSGRIRVTASDGDVREIGPGDIWDMADTHGKGHHTVVTSEGNFECVIIQFD